MLFHSSVRRELARSFGATLVVLATVVMTIMLIRVLGQASRGSVNPSDVLMVMGFTVLSQLPTILALSLFICIVGTLSRMYRDSEMVIWMSAGRGLGALLAPLLRFSWPILAAIAVLSLGVWPWANARIQDMKDRYERRGDIERIAPGQFQESARGNRVFFIDKETPDASTANNVFITASDRGQDVVTSARSGRLATIGEDRFAILNDGQRLESSANKPGLKISDFREFGNRLGSAAQTAQDEIPVRTISTPQLLMNPTAVNQAEFGWRVGLALAAFNFVVMALALSSVNPRAGRSGNLAFALFAFILYYNMLNLGQSWVVTGKVSMAALLVLLHGGVLAACLVLLLKRHLQWSWRSLLGVRRAAA
ncbi:LPS export ABC transporter permease LptF [Xylophilus rhododendri]|uniref:Lipopolysaccharide export system permease protein LptF n=1 Tax=Xylophilus rhododendri TaxID=2697032 RepID=A0A857J0S5_9BURK|nr:LPS export ABC transporter permease LptF [Xylophilus rhododendri]QHI96558.1 LPS export ABC transporter permease LptF [Xylophilus rhododendri]